MKSLILIPLLSFFIISINYAQPAVKVPQIVKQSFQERYPNTQPNWHKARNNYIAMFKQNGEDAIVHYNKQGKLIERGWNITYSKLPQAAVLYLNKYYGGEKNFDTVVKMEDMEGNLMYKAQMGSKEILFDGKGQFIKKQRRRN